VRDLLALRASAVGKLTRDMHPSWKTCYDEYGNVRDGIVIVSDGEYVLMSEDDIMGRVRDAK
jgi:hypothetical protein